MQKVFISQPMKDKTEDEIKAERNWVIEKMYHVLGHDTEIIDSYFDDDPPEGCDSGLYYLGKSIILLGSADVVYMCKNWQHFRGCVIEHECAVRYGKQIMYA